MIAGIKAANGRIPPDLEELPICSLTCSFTCFPIKYFLPEITTDLFLFEFINSYKDYSVGFCVVIL